MTSDLKPPDLFFILDAGGGEFKEIIKSLIDKYLKVNLVTFGVHIICAVLIIACITFWVWKPTSDFIDTNKRKLDRDRKELILNTKETRYFLGQLKTEKIRLSTARRRMEIEARSEADRIIQEAKNSAIALEESMKREAENRIMAMEERAKSRINGAVRELAVELTEKLLEANINDDANRAIIDSYIKDLEEKRIASGRI